MDFMERARNGIETCNHDEDIRQFLDAMDRAHTLCERFNESGRSKDERREILGELFGRDVGEDVEIRAPFYCDVGTNITFGRNLMVNFGCVILDSAEVVIGDNVMIGPRCQLVTPNHSMDHIRRRECSTVARRIVIGDDVWLGAAVTVLPGVTIGDRSVIGAGSVVTKDVPPDSVYAGVPAHPIR